MASFIGRSRSSIVSLTAGAFWLLGAAGHVIAGSILFVGNSFTFGAGSPVLYYRSDTVTDLNGTGLGGVPALFKSFTAQAGLVYDVYLETHPGVGLDWHLEHAADVIGSRAWDSVILQSHSLLDVKRPGDPTLLTESVRQFAALLRARNPAVQIRLDATWPRADQTYDRHGAWYGKPIEAMGHDIRAGYNAAAARTPGLNGVVGVGDAWLLAMHNGVADANPYNGIRAGKVNLWTEDNYHASAYGYYLEALMLFGSVTGRDPRSLGTAECSGFELGLSAGHIADMQKTAAAQLATDGIVLSMSMTPATAEKPVPVRCAPARSAD